MANEPKYGHADGLPVRARTREMVLDRPDKHTQGGTKNVLDAMKRLHAARAS